MKFRAQFNPIDPSPGETNNDPSMTVPDQSLTIREIFKNHTRGIPFHGNLGEPMYYGDLELPSMTDLTDIDAARNNTAALMDVYSEVEKNVRKKHTEQPVQDKKNQLEIPE